MGYEVFASEAVGDCGNIKKQIVLATAEPGVFKTGKEFENKRYFRCYGIRTYDPGERLIVGLYNVMFGFEGSDLIRAIDAWDKKKENYDFCSGTSHDFRGNIDDISCADYLALVWADTTHVGCGKTTCGMKDRITCYYWPSNSRIFNYCRPYKAKDDKFCGDDNPVDNSTERWCGSGGMVGKKTRKEVCEEKGDKSEPLVQCVVEENEKEENEKKVKEQDENEKEKGEEEKERRKRK